MLIYGDRMRKIVTFRRGMAVGIWEVLAMFNFLMINGYIYFVKFKSYIYFLHFFIYVYYAQQKLA